MNSEFVILAVRENDHLFKEICHQLNKDPGIVEWTYFADNTFAPDIKTNIRRKDVYIVLTLDKYPSDVLEKCYELIDAVRRSRPKTITLVMPEHPGQRQDKRHGKRESISVARHAKIFRALCVNHSICVDLHSPQIEGLYDSLDNLSGAPLFADYIKKAIPVEDQDKIVIVSPDAGGMRAASFLSKQFQEARDIAFIQKERIGTNEAKTGKLVGDVKGKVAVLFDDILDTGGTIMRGAEAVKEAGAKRILVCISHALCNNKKGFDNATGKDISQKMSESVIDEFVFLNSRNRPMELIKEYEHLATKMTVLDLSKYLAEAIRRDQIGETIREMVRFAGIENLYTIIQQARH